MSQDLTDVFGAPATSSLRGLLPHRGNGARQPEPPADSATPPDEPSPSGAPAEEEGVPAGPVEGSPAGPRRRVGPVRTTAPAGRPRASRTNRRWGTARVASQDHVELLVLLSLRQGPTDGRGVISRLREDSGGQLDAPEQTIYATVHRLVRGRLLDRRWHEGSVRALYALTDAGERATRARLREWHALSRAVEAVARAGEPS